MTTTGTKKAVRLAATMLAAALALSACGSSGDGDGNNGAGTKLTKAQIYTSGYVGDQAKGTPKDGGVLTIADYAEARSLDPAVTIPNGAAGGNELTPIYDTLMRFDPETSQFVPQLAESLTTEDSVTWTLKLRDGVKFSDGTPLTAVSVVQSIGRYMQNRGYNVLLLATNIADMKPTDATTVVFTLRKPWKTFPNMLASGAGMIVAPAGYSDPKNFKPIGAGPFVLDQYKPGEELTMKANADYWNGKPHLDGLRFIWMAADDAKADALKSGSADVMYVRNPKVLEETRQAGYPGIMTAVGLGSQLWINNREGSPGHDLRVRQAVNYAIDNNVYMQRTNGDHGQPTRSIYAPSAPFNSDIDLADYDLDKAKKLLAEAKADGYDGKIRVLGQSDQQSQAGLVAFKAMLEAAGFTVETEGLRTISDQIKRIYVDHDYDLAVSATSIGEEDPFSRLFTNLYSTSLQNPSGYADKEMDNLIDQLQGADGDAANALLEKINTRWQETVPGVALAAGGFYSAWNKDVHGILGNTETLLMFDQAWKG